MANWPNAEMAKHDFGIMQIAPKKGERFDNYTPEKYNCISVDDGEYVCYAGMWWTPQNKLAYMEPLCTIPEYRSRGLASAALSELYRRMKKQVSIQIDHKKNLTLCVYSH